MTSATRYITSASRYHPRYQSRSSMYIRDLIPRNFAELTEPVPIGLDVITILWLTKCCTDSELHYGDVLCFSKYCIYMVRHYCGMLSKCCINMVRHNCKSVFLTNVILTGRCTMEVLCLPNAVLTLLDIIAKLFSIQIMYQQSVVLWKWYAFHVLY